MYMENSNKTKWNKAHLFKRKKSNKKGVGHPVYVYGKSGRKYKYLLFTHTPEKGKEDDYEKMNHNIDPFDSNSCHVKKKYEVNRSDAFLDPIRYYRIHNDDKELIKKYKK